LLAQSISQSSSANALEKSERRDTNSAERIQSTDFELQQQRDRSDTSLSGGNISSRANLNQSQKRESFKFKEFEA
jgi:hypothetical protein